jgi:hypothetical protein
MTYNPNLGTFLERDPIEAGQNLYQYVHSNPVIRVDPFGLEGANPPTAGRALPTTLFMSGVLNAPSFEIEDIPTMTLSEVDDLWRTYFAARNVPSTNDDPSQPLYQLRPDPKLILDAIEHRQADLRNWEQELQRNRATLEQARDAAVKALNELNWEEAPVVMKTTGLSTLLQKLDKMMYTYPGRLGDIPPGETLASAFRPAERRFRWKNTISWEDAFHEGIHAWDNANRWYTDKGKAGDGWDDSAERLAYASKELVETVKGLAQWEARLRAALENCSSPSFTYELTRVRQLWNKKWEDAGKECPKWTWQGNAPGAVWIPFDLDRDLGDVNAKLKFRLSCSVLRAALEKEYGLPAGFLTCPPSLPLMLR